MSEDPKKRFCRAVPVSNSPHFGTDYIWFEDQRTRNEAVPFNRRATPTQGRAVGEREAFEHWAKETFGFETLDRITAAYYCDSRVQHDWGVWQAARATLTPSAAEGWVCVPREPDDGMVEAGHEALIDGREWGKQQCAADVYAAMIAAAPAAPARTPPLAGLTEEEITALKTIWQALGEVDHAYHAGPGWYTKGETGLRGQVRMWLDRGFKAFASLDRLTDSQKETCHD